MLDFASGSNTPSDIRGFAAIGRPFGVSFPHLRTGSIAAILETAGSGLPVFVDSGAFSEIEFGPNGPVVVRPITRQGWADRMSAYRQLAEALGGDVFLVAPDRIGDQEHTLALLREWAPRLRELREMGANVLVPIQKGTRPQADFHVDVAAVLGFDGWIPAIPSKKNATTVEELAAYVQAIRPPRLHLLGLGSRNRNAARMLEAAAGCEVSVDACLIAAMVGRTNGPGGGPRRLTIARDAAAYLIRTGAAPARYTTQELGVILAFGEPHHIEKALRR